MASIGLYGQYCTTGPYVGVVGSLEGEGGVDDGEGGEEGDNFLGSDLFFCGAVVRVRNVRVDSTSAAWRTDFLAGILLLEIESE